MLYRNRNSKIFLVVFGVGAVLQQLLTSGVLYGWASLAFVLKNERFFYDLCTNVLNNSEINWKKNKVDHCNVQNEQFNLIFTVCISTSHLSEIVVGTLVDRFGSKSMQYIGLAVYTSAGVLFYFATQDNPYWLYLVFILYALGSACLVNSLYTLVNIAYRNARSLALYTLAGVYNASAVQLLLIKVLYENGVALKYSVMGYTSICFFVVLLNTLLCFPNTSTVKEWLAENENFGKPNLEKGDPSNDVSATTTFSKAVNLPCDHTSIFQSLKSRLYVLQLFFLCMVQLKLSCVVGTLNDELYATGADENIVSKYVTIFSMVQFSGLVITPFVGVLLDYKNMTKNECETDTNARYAYINKVKQTIVPLLITSFVGISLCVVSFFRKITLQIPAYVLYVITRALLFANYTAYIGQTFPGQFYGRLFGIGDTILGLFSFLQYFFFWLTKKMGNEPFWTNFILLTLMTLSIVHPFNLYRYYNAKKVLFNTQ